jgi:hypothetical protein
MKEATDVATIYEVVYRGIVMVPGDEPTVTSKVEPDHSPPPEGIVLPKTPFPVWASVSMAVIISLLIFAIGAYYYNVFS